jgi:hypothetical protein
VHEAAAQPVPLALPDLPTPAVQADLPGPPAALRIQHEADLPLAPVRQDRRPTAVPQFDAVTSVLPGPPPGTTTYRLRGIETAQQV